MLLGTECSSVILCAAHDFPALIIQAEDGRHLIAAACALHGGGNILLEADASRFRPGTGIESGNKGLLLHPWLRTDGPGHIVQVAEFVSLIGRKCHILLRDEGLHLHIAGGQKCPGNAGEVDGFLPLIDMERFRQQIAVNPAIRGEARLYLQGKFQRRR